MCMCVIPLSVLPASCLGPSLLAWHHSVWHHQSLELISIQSSTTASLHTHTHTHVLKVTEHAHSTTPCLHDDAITNIHRQYNTNSPVCAVMTECWKRYERTYENQIMSVEVSSSGSNANYYGLINTWNMNREQATHRRECLVNITLHTLNQSN